MQIAGFLKNSLIEWPGAVAAVVFVPGCNFNCPFCYNSHLVFPKNLRLINKSEVLKVLEARKNWLDGVVISGGEPTLQPDLIEFCCQVKKIGLQLMIETNGSQPNVVANLLNKNLISSWAMDFKTTWRSYQKVTKFFKPDKVKQSLRLILDSEHTFFLRTTIVPTIHDFKTLEQMSREIQKMLPTKRDNFFWQWQNYQAKNTLDKQFETLTPFDEDKIRDWQNKLQKTVSFKIVF